MVTISSLPKVFGRLSMPDTALAMTGPARVPMEMAAPAVNTVRRMRTMAERRWVWASVTWRRGVQTKSVCSAGVALMNTLSHNGPCARV